MEDRFTARWNVSPSGELYIGLEAHNGFDEFGDLVIPVWSHYSQGMALQDAGFKNEDILRIREAFLSQYFLTDRFGTDWEMPPDIAVICWSYDTVMEKALRMLKVVVEQIQYIGGDDGFFDYFPNTFNIAEQMVFNVLQSTLLKEAERDSLVAHIAMVRQIAFAMRYSERDYWELINATGAEYEVMEQWKRRNWLIRNPDPNDIFKPWKFTERFWDAMGLPVVMELTA